MYVAEGDALPPVRQVSYTMTKIASSGKATAFAADVTAQRDTNDH